MKVACVQQPACDIEAYEATYDWVIKTAREVCAMGAELIVFPECAYPAYFINKEERFMQSALEKSPRLLEELSKIALTNKVMIAIGIALCEDGKVYNAGVLLDVDGKQVGRVNKSNFWHFDTDIFTQGREYAVFNTSIGLVGMIVCADARMPEIPRLLSVKGAKLIIDMANLTTNGRVRGSVSNPQADYLLRVRAYENDVHLIMADKVGLEANSVVYAGKSCVCAPDGSLIAMASCDKPEIVLVDITLSVPEGQNNLSLRDPAQYAILTAPTDMLPVMDTMNRPISPDRSAVLLGVVHECWPEYSAECLAAVKDWVDTLKKQHISLGIFPVIPCDIERAAIIEHICPLLCDMAVLLAGTRGGEIVAYLCTKQGVVGEYRAKHGADASYYKLPFGTLGVMTASEALSPEYARCMMLQGVDVIAWLDEGRTAMTDAVLCARASENKMFVVRASAGDADNSAIAVCDGRIISESFWGERQAVCAMASMSAARDKTVISGTHLVYGRQPEQYKELTK